MPQFKKMKMRINNTAHSKAVQEWLFEQGYSWETGTNEPRNLCSDILYTGTFKPGRIEHDDTKEEGAKEEAEQFYKEQPHEEIDVRHLDPLLNVQEPCTEKSKMESEFEKLSTQLKHLDKAIESHENKQNKRKLDRKRVLQKMEGMLPEGYGICLTGGVSEYPESLEEGEGVAEFDPREVVVGSVWECVDWDGASGLTVGKEYKVLYLDEDNDPGFENDVANDVWLKEDFLASFKRVS